MTSNYREAQEMGMKYTTRFRADKAIEFVQEKYSMFSDLNISYSSTLTDYGETELSTGNISIGKPAFGSGSLLKATIAHEDGHFLDRIFVDGSWQWKDINVAPWNYNDGVVGYESEILNSGKLHILRSTLSEINNGFEINPVWYAHLIKGQWWLTLPLRF